jgi:hypothetical protein
MIDCAACVMGFLGYRRPVLVAINGELYAFHRTCLTPGRHRRTDARPLTEAERREIEDGRHGYDRIVG